MLRIVNYENQARSNVKISCCALPDKGFRQIHCQASAIRKFAVIADELNNEYLVDVDISTEPQAWSRKFRDFGGAYHHNPYFIFSTAIRFAYYYEGDVYEGLPEDHADFGEYAIGHGRRGGMMHG